MIKRNIKPGLLAVCISIISLSAPLALAESNLYELPLKDLLQIIVIASKKEERVFDSPMAATVITRADIQKSGASNIPEALRLAPGIIVREQSSGNYDIHIRGLDNVPPRSIVRTASNNLTLVMIDNRPVYNHFNGGTLWETLPVSLIDIERIEIIRGAASALYGPNAVTGVINIVTQSGSKKDSDTQLNIQRGSFNSTIAGLSSSKRFANDVTARISLNMEQRERQSSRYYDWSAVDYVDTPQDINAIFPSGPLENPDEKYPDPANAIDKVGANFFLNKELSNNRNIALSFGAQKSEVQKIYDDNAATPLSTTKNDSWYIDFKSETKNVNSTLSYQAGSSDTLGYRFGFDYSNLDLLIETKKELGDFVLQPLLQYHVSTYSGETFPKEESIATTSAGIRSEYRKEKLRLIATMRGDYYNFSESTEYSHMLGGTYTITENTLIYGVHAQAHQEPFMSYTFEEIFFPLAPDFGFLVLGNEDLELLKTENIEFGFRWKTGKNTKIELEYFEHDVENYQYTFKNGDTGYVGETFVEILQHQNIPTQVNQRGLTFNFSYMSQNWASTFYLTRQNSDMKNLVEFVNYEQAEITDSKNIHTPDYFGGISFNYYGWQKTNFNINGYFLDAHKQINAYSAPGKGSVPDNFILSMKLSYQLNPSAQVYFNIKNMLDKGNTEFAFADPVGASYFIGFEWGL